MFQDTHACYKQYGFASSYQENKMHANCQHSPLSQKIRRANLTRKWQPLMSEGEIWDSLTN